MLFRENGSCSVTKMAAASGGSNTIGGWAPTNVWESFPRGPKGAREAMQTTHEPEVHADYEAFH